MALVINTNMSSLTAQNNLSNAQSRLSKATEELSSGLKINSSADNAADYTIANNFTTEIGGLDQASSNANDAISLTETGDAALSSITSNLNAIRDLAVQAANGTYNSTDRSEMNSSVQQYLSEISRIANQTSFNGINILNGSKSNVSFQIGSDIGQNIDVALSGVTASQLGTDVSVLTSSSSLSGAFVSSGGDAETVALSGITIDGVQLSGTLSSAQDIVDAINTTDFSKEDNSSSTLPSNGSISAALNSDGSISVYQIGGGNVSITESGAVSSDSKAGSTGYVFGATETGTSSGSLADGSVATKDDANLLIAKIDSALSSVSNLSSTFGSYENRFQSIISSVSSESDNLTSSKGRMVDLDFALETAELSKSEVLEQAGISVLATANSQPQQILKLLQ